MGVKRFVSDGASQQVPEGQRLSGLAGRKVIRFVTLRRLFCAFRALHAAAPIFIPNGINGGPQKPRKQRRALVRFVRRFARR